MKCNAQPNNWKAVSISFQKTNKFEFSILLLFIFAFFYATTTTKKALHTTIYTWAMLSFILSVSLSISVVPNMVHEKHTFSIKQAFDMKANQIKEITSHPFWLSCFVCT